MYGLTMRDSAGKPASVCSLDAIQREAVASPRNSIHAETGDEYPGPSTGIPRGQLRRRFRTRHIQMIALGANIGSGVYIASGKVSVRLL